MHNRREYKNKIFVGITWWKIKKIIMISMEVINLSSWKVRKIASNKKTGCQNDPKLYEFTWDALITLLHSSSVLFVVFMILQITHQNVDTCFKVTSGITLSLTTLFLVFLLILKRKRTSHRQSLPVDYKTDAMLTTV